MTHKKNVSLEKSLLNIDFFWWQLRENKKNSLFIKKN